MEILMIDKARPLTKFYRRMLINAGFLVKEAHSAQNAFKICRSQTFDLIIVAAHVPWQEFVDSIVILREECPKTKIIAYGAKNLIANVNVEKCLKACSVKGIGGENPSLMALLNSVYAVLGDPGKEFVKTVYA